MSGVEEEIEIVALPGKRLRFPGVEVNGKTYDELVLREPTAGDLIAMRKKSDPIEQMVELLKSNTGLSPFVIHALPQRVLEAASDYFAGFSPPSPPTGGG